MLNFDSDHKSFKGNIKEKRGRLIRNTVLAGLMIANLFTFSGCAKEVPCSIEKPHAHLYVYSYSYDKDNPLTTYIPSEKDTVWGRTRTEQYIFINKEEEELLKFAEKRCLYRIDENRESLENIISNLDDQIEFEYSKKVYISVGKGVSRVTKHYWTRDPNEENLTGNTRVCHHIFHVYKIIKNENGKYESIKSDDIDDFSNLPEGYDYIEDPVFFEKEYVNYNKMSEEDINEYRQAYNKEHQKQNKKH